MEELKRRRGHPFLPPEQRRSESVRVRMTPAEMDEVCREALRTGRTVAAMIRERIFPDCRCPTISSGTTAC